MADTDAAKYLDEPEIEVPPHAVLAPYFFMSETTLPAWMKVNLACIGSARRHHPAPSVLYAPVVIDRGVLVDHKLRIAVAEAYADTPVDGFLLWVDNLDEHSASGSDLTALVDLARRLREPDSREVINLHGGFFSILAGSRLGDNSFSGVIHGPEFGEFRGVVPVGGGIPIARYYVPQLHARVRYRDALRLFREKGWLESAKVFHQNVCDCEECQRTLGGNAENFSRFGEANVRTVRRKGGLARIDFPTAEASGRCLRHYLQRKRREYHAAMTFDADQLVTSVSRGYHELESVAGSDGVGHLKLWLRALGRDVRPADEFDQ
jgi:hypothetical protein